MEKKVSPSVAWTGLGNTGANVTSYVDNAVSNPGAQYFYRVRAYNSDGNSNYSNEAIAQIPDAFGAVGQAGGTVEVTDPRSPVFGIKLTIPANVVQTETVFTVSHLDTAPQVPLPTGVVQDGPQILISASAQLNGPVAADVPFSSRIDDTELLLLFHLNETSASWEVVEPLPTPDPTKMKASLFSFSTYVKGRVSIGLTSISWGRCL